MLDNDDSSRLVNRPAEIAPRDLSWGADEIGRAIAPTLRLPKHSNLDSDQQRLFIRLLSPNVEGFTFQTFPDNKSIKDRALTRVIQSPTDAELLQLHAHGAGIYATVNETDGKGRKTENIKRIRAVWQEDDDGFDGAFPLHPSMVVETSPGHFHRYWLVADDWPTDALGRADFAAVMERMVESYGSDKNAKDISRVLRFPGFLHRKSGTPHLVRIVETSGCRYSRAEIVAAFPPVERAKKPHIEGAWTPQGDDEQRIRDALYSINADERDLWLQCGMAIKDHFGDSGRPLWDGHAGPPNSTSATRTGHGGRSSATESLSPPFFTSPGWRAGGTMEVSKVRRNGNRPVMPDQVASAMTPAQKNRLAG